MIKGVFLWGIVVFSACFSSCGGQNISSDHPSIYFSKSVGDSFEIYIDSLPAHKQNSRFKIFLYLDANLNSGKELRQFLRDSFISPTFDNTLFVGIGHIGNYRVLRRRDFMVPGLSGNDTLWQTANQGQSESFYHFLQDELIPYIHARFPTYRDSSSILGHSFGGLFAIYCLLKNEPLFQRYYALSPSLWVNNGSIYQFDRLPLNNGNPAWLFISVGSRENLNRVKPSSDRFKSYMEKRKLPYIHLDYRVYEGQSHYSQVGFSVRDIFNERK